MPPPCQHSPLQLPTPPTFNNGCYLCYLYETREEYRNLWDGHPVVAAIVKHALPCIYLGKLISRKNCPCARQDVRQCDKGHGQVSQATVCETCSDYQADS
jgi:hypothetical protein